MWYSQTGNIGIGTSSPGDSLTVDGSMRIDSTTLYVDPSTNRVGGGSWATFSDGRLKNIDGEFKAGSAELMKLNPVKYRYRKDNPVGIRDGAEHVGSVAQEVKEAIPEAVESNNSGYLREQRSHHLRHAQCHQGTEGRE